MVVNGVPQRAHNFGAGPAKLPDEVLHEVQNELFSYHGCGMSVMEISHRSKDFMKINNNAQECFREIMNIPDNYKVLFMQGGATGAFAAIALNLINRTGTADYCVTGTWSKKAAAEAAKYGKVNLVFPVQKKFTTIPDRSTWNLNPNASYVYYCANETVDGVEYPDIPETNGVPLVSDMSSSIMTREFDVSKFAVIFGGAQKNLGPAGVTFVIIREDFLGNAMPICPAVFDFTNMAENNSLHNTPSVIAVYVMERTFEWVKRNGGLSEMQRQSNAKSQLVFDAIETSNGFYYCPVDKQCRSTKNIPFRIGGPNGNEDLESQFIEGAENIGLQQLKGHRSVGGLRVSLYNATGIESVEILMQYMKAFQKKHCTKTA